MRRIGNSRSEPLYGAASTRAIERAASAALPAHSLMALAGLSVARLTRALAPHAQCIWVACGPGNNGADGLVAATHLHRQAQSRGGTPKVVVTLCADTNRMPSDAAHALEQALATGMRLASEPPPDFDFAIDALLGIGGLRPPEGRLADHLTTLQNSEAPVLCVDVPSGLDADTGVHLLGPTARPLQGTRHTLSLLTLKPGLFTADGRDQAGCVWFDDLGVTPPLDVPSLALLHGMSSNAALPLRRAHASHKGSYGDVLVIGGQDIAFNGSGMTGAAILAARAALHSGAGRVYVGLLSADTMAQSPTWDPDCPELMFRQLGAMLQGDLLSSASVVCGCGGGDAVARVLPQVLSRARTLVLDADALNSIAGDSQLQAQLLHRHERGWTTVITPHPLEAARLLASTSAEVLANRLTAARQLSETFAVICVLKGSGSVTCAPGATPLVNPTGDASLATAGTGDVLAGMIGNALNGRSGGREGAIQQVASAVFLHGLLADEWALRLAPHPPGFWRTLTAAHLAESARPLD